MSAPSPREHDPPPPSSAREAVDRLEDAVVDLEAAQAHGEEGSARAEDDVPPVPGSPEPPD